MIGRQLAETSSAMDSDGKLRNVEIIGISVGAFAADSCAKWLHQGYNKDDLAPKRVQPYTELTLLDPFTSKGIFG